MKEIEITFVNQSDSRDPVSVVLFSKNTTPQGDEAPVAWKVIHHISKGWMQKIRYPLSFHVNSVDLGGVAAETQLTQNGQVWEVVRSNIGPVMRVKGKTVNPQSIEIVNGLEASTIHAQVFKDGTLFALKTGIAPLQKAVFTFRQTLWIGVASNVQQGDILNASILAGTKTEIPLLGISKANLIMTGGGSKPYDFMFVPN